MRIPIPQPSAWALRSRRRRILWRARIFALVPLARAWAYHGQGITPGPKDHREYRLRALIRAHRAAGTLGPWWCSRHLTLLALLVATHGIKRRGGQKDPRSSRGGCQTGGQWVGRDRNMLVSKDPLGKAIRHVP